MKLKLIKPYKSIKALQSAPLPDFTLITGKNGAGKTQLLKMLNGVKDKNSQKGIAREIHVFSGNSDERINSSVYFDFSSFAYDRWSNDSSCLQNDEREDLDYIENEKKYEKFTDGSLGNNFYFGCRNYLENELKFYRDQFNEIYKGEKFSKAAFDVNEYRKTHTPPWKIFEKLIIAYNNNNLLDESAYEALPINLPKDRGAATDKFLISKDGVKLYSRDLSSGEKALMGLCYLIYVQEQNTKLPELLLLDEIDSTLHPSVIKSLLRAIQEVFVKQYGLKVIMVTHSPTTVALAPENSIFTLSKSEAKHVLAPCEQRAAIDLLLEGVNTIALDPSNTKQVFVESDVDANIYTKLYQYYKRQGSVSSEIDLAFISSGNKKSVNTGSCSVVKKTVKALRQNGNTRIFGLVDQDGKNECQSDGIYTLKRYSIENYILDPLVMLKAVFSMSENREYSANIFPKDKVNSPSDVDKLSESVLQKYVDHLADYLGFENAEKTSVSYGKINIELPSVFITTKGHYLADVYRKKLQFLKYYDTDEKLMIKIIGNLNDLDGFNFLSEDIPMIFNDISNRKH